MFLKGSKILMVDNLYKNIEELTDSDHVISCFSKTPVKIKRIFQTPVIISELDPTNVPHKINKSFFAPGLPCEDVVVSGHHRIILKHNNTHMGVQSFKIVTPLEDCPETAIYYHIELECEETNGVIVSGIAMEAMEHNY
jgi:hypothetical protein